MNQIIKMIEYIFLIHIFIFCTITCRTESIQMNYYPESFKILAVAGKVTDGNQMTDDVELIDPFVEASNCSKPSNYPIATAGITGSGGDVCGGGYENW